ncbi:MAG: hypothetical protein D6785_01025 [Planctomycetota bacterium]|nr:MAG: hypothetical protein D6785_01025 [Planctomycetota bacterium]
MAYIPCSWCKKEYPQKWVWFICEKCGYRVCQGCLSKHQGKYSKGGFKCSQCNFGQMKRKEES